MKILLLGRHGQVGWELQRALSPLGTLTAAGREGRWPTIDLTRPEALKGLVRELAPEVIVNAAAYTAVDRAEEERDLSWCINAEAPGILAEASHRVGALLVHYSTDYVFSGLGENPWRESDMPAPINHYGAAKLAGERAIAAVGGRHLIFRISWVHAPRGRNFALSMLKLMQERDRLAVVNDQVGAPTPAELVASVTAKAIPQALAEPEKSGLYHLAATGETSWYEYSRFIAEYLREHGISSKISPGSIMPVTSDRFPTLARRPANSRLDVSRLKETFSLHLPSWEQGVSRTLDAYLKQRSEN